MLLKNIQELWSVESALGLDVKESLNLAVVCRLLSGESVSWSGL